MINDHTGHYFLSAGWDKTVRAYNLGSFSDCFPIELRTVSFWIARVFENNYKQILRISTYIMMLFVIQPKQFYQSITIHLMQLLLMPLDDQFIYGNGAVIIKISGWFWSVSHNLLRNDYVRNPDSGWRYECDDVIKAVQISDGNEWSLIRSNYYQMASRSGKVDFRRWWWTNKVHASKIGSYLTPCKFYGPYLIFIWLSLPIREFLSIVKNMG